jgi:hypothetical protein
VALFGPVQAFGEVGGVEPGRERPGQPARPEQAGVAVGDQVTEWDKADQPALHLPGVSRDRQVDVVAGIVRAHGDRVAYVLNYQIITSEGTTIASTMTYLLLVVLIVLGVVVLNEPIAALAGIALILIGVALTRRRVQTDATDRAHCCQH